MHQLESEYLLLLADVLQNGKSYMDRTGTGAKKVFGRQIRGHLKDGFPAITTKQLYWKSAFGEMLWFIAGSSDNKELAKMTFGDESRRTIWSGNANDLGLPGSENAWLRNPHRKGEDDVGRVYGVQWRQWLSHDVVSYGDYTEHLDGAVTYTGAKVRVQKHDQIAQIIRTLKNNPQDRRMVLTAFNVGEIDRMALPPCHMFAQFDVDPETKELNCQVYLRSNDLFLGLPFNIASYAFLTHMLAHVTGHAVGELVMTIGNAHIYSNHIEQVKEQLSRTAFDAPFLMLNPDITDINKFTMGDIALMNYKSHPPIKGEMAV